MTGWKGLILPIIFSAVLVVVLEVAKSSAVGMLKNAVAGR